MSSDEDKAGSVASNIGMIYSERKRGRRSVCCRVERGMEAMVCKRRRILTNASSRDGEDS